MKLTESIKQEMKQIANLVSKAFRAIKQRRAKRREAAKRISMAKRRERVREFAQSHYSIIVLGDALWYAHEGEPCAPITKLTNAAEIVKGYENMIDACVRLRTNTI